MEQLLDLALGERALVHETRPLVRGGVGRAGSAGGTDEARGIGAELAALEGVAQVEELHVVRACDRPEAATDARSDRVARPIRVAVVEGAAAAGRAQRVTLGITVLGCAREGRRIALEHEPVGRGPVPVGVHHHADVLDRFVHAPQNGHELEVERALVRGLARRAEAEVGRDAVLDDRGEPEVVAPYRQDDQLDLARLGDEVELVGLRRLALEALAAVGAAEDVRRLRARAREVELQVRGHVGGEDLRDVGAVAAVHVGAVDVDAAEVGVAHERQRADRRAIGARPVAGVVDAVAVPAAGLAGDVGVPQRDDRVPRRVRVGRGTGGNEQAREHHDQRHRRPTHGGTLPRPGHTARWTSYGRRIVRGVMRCSAATALAWVSLAGVAQAEDMVVPSFDGTPIVAHWFPNPALSGNERATGRAQRPGLELAWREQSVERRDQAPPRSRVTTFLPGTRAASASRAARPPSTRQTGRGPGRARAHRSRGEESHR